MRLRIFMLIAICVVLDVLVVRQVRKYDEQKATNTYEQLLEEQEAMVASVKKNKAGQADSTHVSKSSTTPC